MGSHMIFATLNRAKLPWRLQERTTEMSTETKYTEMKGSSAEEKRQFTNAIHHANSKSPRV